MMLPHMIPYAEPFYFFLLAIALVPIVLSLLIWEKKITSLSISSDTFLFICQLWR